MRSNIMIFTAAMLCASNIPANAISWNTQMNCASDYYAYCSKHTAGSPGCHACMRSNRPRLSNACVSALIDDGVLAKADPATQRPKNAVTAAKAKPAMKSIVKERAAKIAAVRLRSKAASNGHTAKAVRSARLETVARTSQRQSRPPQQPAQTALEIDQQTFEAFKNRAPNFLPKAEIEAANAAP